MTVLAADRHLPAVWPELWPLLEPAVRRSPDRPDVLARLNAHDAQLWGVYEAGRPLGGAVTMLQDHPGGRRCLFWLIGGRCARTWGGELVETVARWARPLGCVALWGAGRRGWAPIVAAFGFRRIADFEGQPAWERRLA